MTTTPNSISNILPKILARGLMTLRQQVIMPRLVNSDYSTDAAKKGDVINVPIPQSRVATDVTPAETPPAPAPTTPGNVQIALNNWKHSDFHLSDKDLKQIDENEHFVPGEMEEAVKALANAVNQQVMGLYVGVYGAVGTAGVTPFATDVTAATNARKVLNQQLCPKDLRRGVVNFDAEANMLALAAFRDISQSNDPNVLNDGTIGSKFGIDWYSDDHVVTHTTNILGTGAMTVNGVQAANVGSTDDGRTGTLSIAKAAGVNWIAKAGDLILFTVGGIVQSHVITANTTITQATNTTVPIAPALRVATAGGEVVTSNSTATTVAAGTSVVNLVFRRDAIAFATRPLADIKFKGGSDIMSLQDPKSGLVLRLEVMRQYKQTVWDFDILWGSALVQPANIVRILG